MFHFLRVKGLKSPTEQISGSKPKYCWLQWFLCEKLLASNWISSRSFILGVNFASGPGINESQSSPSPQDAPAGLQHHQSWLPAGCMGRAAKRQLAHSNTVALNFTLLPNKLLHFSFIFSEKTRKPCAWCLQLFAQGRTGVPALPEIFGVSKANSADLFHTLASVGFSKPAEQRRSRAVLQGRL